MSSQRLQSDGCKVGHIQVWTSHSPNCEVSNVTGFIISNSARTCRCENVWWFVRPCSRARRLSSAGAEHASAGQLRGMHHLSLAALCQELSGRPQRKAFAVAKSPGSVVPTGPVECAGYQRQGGIGTLKRPGDEPMCQQGACLCHWDIAQCPGLSAALYQFACMINLPV